MNTGRSLGARPARGFALLGAPTVLAWWAIRSLGDARTHLGRFYGWFALAFLAYLAALWLARQAERHGAAGSRPGAGLLVIGLVGGLCRAFLFGGEPTFSEDLYRYRWDGAVQAAGFDPYARAPEDPALVRVRDETFARVAFPHLRTVYPPLLQLAFRLGTGLGGTVAAHKAVALLAELLLVLALAAVLAARGRSLLWLVGYVWHPLTILEIAGSGHHDPVGVAALWAGLAAWQAGRRPWASVAWAAGVLAKYLPVVFVPWWWCRRTGRGWAAVLLGLSVMGVLLSPSLVGAVIETFSAMQSRVASNAPLHLLLVRTAGPRLALWLTAAAWGALVLWWARHEPDPVRYFTLTAAAAAFLAPALHPWYLLWLIPSLCVWPAPALLALSGTVVLAYTVWPGYLAGGTWAVPLWALTAEYAPAAALLVWSGIRNDRSVRRRVAVTPFRTPR